jgi:hypothetical protein
VGIKHKTFMSYKRGKKTRKSNQITKQQSYNLQGLDEEKTTIDELYMLDSLISDKLEDYIGGGSYEGNGRNFNFTFNGKPYLMRIEIDDFHYELWKNQKQGYWSDDFDRNKLLVEKEIKGKTISNSRKYVDIIPSNRITWRFKRFVKEKVLYNILPIIYKYTLKTIKE